MEQLNVPWLMIGFVWILNFAISWFNARTCGMFWSEVKMIGGWQKFMGWMGAIMSASGFTWCYMVVLLFGAYYAQPSFVDEGDPYPIDPEALQAGFSLGYLIIIPGVLFSGLMIWIDSLVQAWRRRDLASMGIAGWNTFAQIHNTYSAMRGVPEAIGSVTEFFGGSKGGSKKDGGVIILVLIVLALAGGILTTWSIINHYAGTRPIPQHLRRA